MKIAILVRRLSPPGGAEWTMLNISDKLSEDHDVRIFGFKKEPGDVPENAVSAPMPTGTHIPITRLNKIIRHYKRATEFRKPVEQYDPDIILAQHRPALLIPYLQRACNARTIIFLHDLSQVKFPYASLAGRSYASFDRYVHSLAYDKADRVIANSEFVATEFESEFGFYPSVIYPYINTEKYHVKSTGDKILFVNPKYEKGVDIMLEVANQLGSEEFIVVGPDPSDEAIEQLLNRAENVDFRGYVDCMRDVYKETKLVLFPSRWKEPFGRIPVEAGISGIPTIAADRGGLPESVGIDDCIVHSDSPDDYVDRIQTVLDNYPYYSTEARLNAREKSTDLNSIDIININS